MLGTIEPMLATRGEPSSAHRWAVEPKLDGWRAIVHVDAGSRPRSSRSTSSPSTARSLLAQPYRLLDELALAGPAWHTTSVFVDGFLAVVETCERMGLEGVVFKRLDSRYRPGQRSRDWRKLKTVDWRETHAPRRHEWVSPTR